MREAFPSALAAAAGDQVLTPFLIKKELVNRGVIQFFLVFVM